MFNLFRAEIRKILSQRWMAILLLWIWPIGGIVVPLTVMALTLLNPPDATQTIKPTFLWTDTALSAWFVPTNLFGRILFITLASATFASEYQWGTWKNIVPRADRARLILAKYLAFTSILMVSIVVTSGLLTVGTGLLQTARSLPYPPEINSDVLQTFARDYLLEALLTLINTVIGVAFGAILATLTRSLVGGIIGGLTLVIGELGFISGVTTFGFALQSPEIAGLVRFTSSINIGNVQSWVRSGQPLTLLMKEAPTNSLAASFVILALWLIVLVALNLWIFQKQDLT